MNETEINQRLREMRDVKDASIAKFNDRALAVSTSFLAFSITFRASIIGDAPQHLWLLQLAWFSLALCTVCSAFIALAAMSAADAVIEGLRKGNDSSASANPIYGLLQYLLFVAFPIGIVGMMIFGVVNIDNR